MTLGKIRFPAQKTASPPQSLPAALRSDALLRARAAAGYAPGRTWSPLRLASRGGLACLRLCPPPYAPLPSYGACAPVTPLTDLVQHCFIRLRPPERCGLSPDSSVTKRTTSAHASCSAFLLVPVGLAVPATVGISVGGLQGRPGMLTIRTRPVGLGARSPQRGSLYLPAPGVGDQTSHRSPRLAARVALV